ncbi:uncharacterized protein LOC111004132 [Pieris rapae]|uniref:uncharacterized protein LOC111004132 n=1 Tax=Pieris rapae TaxID=64459 RepID=UPI001E280A82|nr:uncharacterized protein LOC111004132 [Pieris rapae]
MLTNPEEIARHGGTQIYTDGSKTSTGVGAAWTEWKDGMEINSKKMKMAPHCTVFQAELMALRNATSHVDKNKRDVKIYSDSKSALDAIVSGRSLDPQVAEIRRSLEECRRTGTHISLFWIKAHVGTPGNERADTLAKEASEKLRSEPEYAAYPLSYIKHQIRQRTLEVWNERYLGGETAGTTKLFIGNVKTAYKLVKEKRFTPQMAQILTGHGAFAYYLHRFKIRTSPTCACSDEEQTVEHVLLHCPIFASSRHDLEQQIQMTVDRNGLQDILIKHRPCLERFCEKIVVYIKAANKTERAGLAGNCAPARP